MLIDIISIVWSNLPKFNKDCFLYSITVCLLLSLNSDFYMSVVHSLNNSNAIDFEAIDFEAIDFEELSCPPLPFFLLIRRDAMTDY